MGGIKTTLIEVRQGPDWIEADYTFSRVSGKQPLAERFIMGKREGQARPDAKDLMTVRTEYPYQKLKFQTGGSADPALDLWNAYVPRDKLQRTNHTYGLMMIRRPSIPGLLNILWPVIVWFTNRIFTEDRNICELEQAAFDRQGADRNHEIFPVIRALRSVLVQNGVFLDTTPGEPGVGLRPSGGSKT
jgi:hypothetical protein